MKNEYDDFSFVKVLANISIFHFLDTDTTRQSFE